MKNKLNLSVGLILIGIVLLDIINNKMSLLTLSNIGFAALNFYLFFDGNKEQL